MPSSSLSTPPDCPCCCNHCTCLACPYFCPLTCNITDEQLEAVDVGIIHIKPVVTKKPLDGIDAPLNIEMQRDVGESRQPVATGVPYEGHGTPSMKRSSPHLVDGVSVRSDASDYIP